MSFRFVRYKRYRNDAEKVARTINHEGHKLHKEKDARVRVLCWGKEFWDLIIFALEESKNKRSDADKANVWQ
jgi:hypothetical protein